MLPFIFINILFLLALIYIFLHKRWLYIIKATCALFYLQKVAASWVLSMLASLHWRVVGKPRNALDCLQLALDAVPHKFRDVPLISIASISHKFSLIDNALSVTEEAFKINSVEVSLQLNPQRVLLFRIQTMK